MLLRTKSQVSILITRTMTTTLFGLGGRVSLWLTLIVCPVQKVIVSSPRLPPVEVTPFILQHSLRAGAFILNHSTRNLIP